MSLRSRIVNVARVVVVLVAAAGTGGACEGGCSGGLDSCGCQRRVPCGAEGQACCGDDRVSNPCNRGLACIANVCTTPPPPCGAEGEPCCASLSGCNGDLSCIDQTCRACGALRGRCCAPDNACVRGASCNDAGLCTRCGGEGEPCCAGACNPSRLCVAGRCVACGGPGQPCCADATRCAYQSVCIEQPGGPQCRHCGEADEPCCVGVLRCAIPELACALDNRCHPAAARCGGEGGPCCERGACGEGRVCTDPEVLAELDARDAGDGAVRDASDAPDADDAGDAGDASDAGDAGDAGDLDDVAWVFGVCAPCGAIGQLCCAGSRCVDPRSACTIDRASVPTCGRCGGIGGPCCASGATCDEGAQCIVRPGVEPRCEALRDAAVDGR